MRLLIEAARMALYNLWNNKLRSFLTLLGVAIGLGATISLIGLGLAFKDEMMKDFDDFGPHMLIVFPTYQLTETGRVEQLTIADRRAIEAICQERIKSVVPINYGGSAEMRYLRKKTNSQITGTTPEFLTIQGLKLARGRYLNPADLSVGRKVVVFDWRVKEKLFGQLNAVGKSVTFAGDKYQVIGEIARKDSNISLGVQNDGMNIYLPITTLQRLMRDQSYDVLYIVPSDLRYVDETIKIIKGLLAKRHGVDGAFEILSLEELKQMMIIVMGVITALLGLIGGIALTVGGIGIMNIMLVTVMERVKEIGLRKAVGGKRSSILWQFVTEAIILCLTGGLMGLGFSFAVALWINKHAPLQLVISSGLVSMAFIFAAAVGLFFGVFPAWKAAKMDPITALGYE